MIALEEKRSTLQNQITVVDERLAAIQNELYNGIGRSAVKELPLKKQAAAPQAKSKRKGRGELKGQILEILQAAGKTGASVKDLAGRIGVKNVNVHAWFAANIKKIAGLKKIGAARYALNGSAPVQAPQKAKVAKPKKAKKAKAAKAAKAPNALKVSKVVPKGKSGKVKAGRGQLKGKIVSLLKGAGNEGMTIKDLAAKLKANYKNVYIWFVTTGKKIAEIKKAGPAQYKWEAA